MAKTKWMLFECAGGNRWSSTMEDCSLKPCNFSGCDCKGKVTKVATTTSWDKAAKWFRRATGNKY